MSYNNFVNQKKIKNALCGSGGAGSRAILLLGCKVAVWGSLQIANLWGKCVQVKTCARVKLPKKIEKIMRKWRSGFPSNIIAWVQSGRRAS